jgi:PKD repeat protein
MSTIKTLSFVLIAALLLLSFGIGRAQCNNNEFTMSADTVCGNEVVTFTIIDPNPNLSYFWNFGQGGGIDVEGDVVTHVYPARDFTRNYNITVFNGQGTCIQTLTVLSTPDAALVPLSGVLVDGNTIAYCLSTSDFPEFDLTVQNTSETTSANTNYTIDWGDGSPVWSSSEFTTASHVYMTQGQFNLTLTVQGNTGCPEAVTEYVVFNSSDPGGSIVNTTNTVTTCYPNTIGYPILGTGNNIVGTTYEISISGDLVATYNHPPPDTFFHTFEETSCGQGFAPFDQDEFVIQMQVISPCQDKLSFVTARLGTPPLASFDMFPSVICPGETITLTNTSDGSLNSQALCSELQNANWMIEPRTYNIITGDTLNSSTLEFEPLQAVPYTVTMWVENMCGIDSAIMVAEVGLIPDADASAVLNPGNGCAPATAEFTNLSAYDPSISYSWSISPSQGASFTGGTNAGSFEPEIEFTEAGLYTVTLTAGNDCGEPTWDTTFDIRNRPGIDFPSIGSLCVTDYIFNSNVSITGNPDVVNWTFSGGTPATYSGLTPPPVAFTGTGNYSVTVTASNSCGDSTRTENFQLSDPVIIDAGPDFVACFNDGIQSLTAIPAGGAWSGEGVIGNDLFHPGATTSDFITLTYTYDNGICTVSDTRDVEIVRMDSLSAGPDIVNCVNDTPYLLDGGYPAGGTWTGAGIVNAGSGLFDPSAAGIGIHAVGYVYTEPLHGCSDTVYREINVLDIPPIIMGTESNACVGALVTLSTDFVPGAEAVWDFGDGNSEEGFEVGHIYTYEDDFTVVITVSAGSCANMDSTIIHTIDLPHTSFSLSDSTGCNGLEVEFTNESTGMIDEFHWDFGIDSLTSVAPDPAGVIYPAGILNDTVYFVTLTATGWCGPASHTEEVFIGRPPVAGFGINVNSICPGEELFFNNITYNSPENFHWDFGNGVISSDEDPDPQVYSTPPADTLIPIVLVASNECGADTAVLDILVKTTNVTSFFNTDPLSGCAPLEVNFVNFSDPDAFIVWDFDDGNTATADSVLHVFQESGTYSVSLAVDNGCTKDTSWLDIEVLQSPVINFEHAALSCERSAVEFTNSSQGAFGFQWDFGDGNVSGNVSPENTYTDAGTYTVTLTGENQFGCSSSLSSEISVLAKPQADFDASENSFCAGSLITFNNQSTGGENFAWDFGDGTVSYSEYPDKRYSEAGIYDVTLVANTDNFCYDTITYPGVVEVYPLPDADFDYQQSLKGIEYGEVEFINLSQDAIIFEWDFGDGSGSNEADPVHQYTHSGQYAVSLAAVNQYDCTDTILQFVDVEFFGKLFVPNAFSPLLGDGSEASVFLPKGIALQEYELEIYSSYGELLWRNNELLDGSPAVGWDGTSNGKALPQDVYIWKIRAIFDNGLSWEGSDVGQGVRTTIGSLTLIR